MCGLLEVKTAPEFTYVLVCGSSLIVVLSKIHYLDKPADVRFVSLDPFNSHLSTTSNEKKPTHHCSPRRRRAAAPSGTAPAEEKQMPQYLSLLQRSDCGEVGATGGSQVKTITIRLPDVEAAMLVEVQKRNRDFRNIQVVLVKAIRQEYDSHS